RDHGRREADDERYPRTVDDLREQVPAERRLDTQQEMPAHAAPRARGRDAAEVWIDLVWMELVDRVPEELVDHIGEDRDQDEEDDEGRADERDAVPFQPRPGDAPQRPTLDLFRFYAWWSRSRVLNGDRNFLGARRHGSDRHE